MDRWMNEWMDRGCRLQGSNSFIISKRTNKRTTQWDPQWWHACMHAHSSNHGLIAVVVVVVSWEMCFCGWLGTHSGSLFLPSFLQLGCPTRRANVCRIRKHLFLCHASFNKYAWLSSLSKNHLVSFTHPKCCLSYWERDWERERDL
jgi:hypothetical protein